MKNPDQQSLSLPAAIYLGIAASSVLLILPVFVGAVLQLDGFGTAHAGWVGSADLIGYALGSVAAFRLITTRTWKQLCVGGLVLMVVGNMATLFVTDSFAALMTIRIGMAGLGAGLVIAIPYTALGRMPDSDRATGLYWTFNVVGGSIGLLIFPMITLAYGPAAVFAGLALVSASAIPVAIMSIDSGRSVTTPRVSTHSLLAGLSRRELLLLITIAVFNLGLGGVWAFIDSPAKSLGLSGAAIGWILSGTYLTCMLGSSAAAWQGKKLGLALPYLGAMMVMTLAITTLAGAGSILLYIAVLALINFGWNYGMTYQFIAVYDAGQNNKTPTLIFFAQSIGLMFGPALSGSIATRLSIESSFLGAAVLCLVSALFYAVAVKKGGSKVAGT